VKTQFEGDWGVTSRSEGEAKGGVMSDQADNLRQLVRARREWRETAEEPPVVSPGTHCSARMSFLAAEAREETRSSLARKGGGLLVALAARWAFARISR
jgi:hypothetical protein